MNLAKMRSRIRGCNKAANRCVYVIKALIKENGFFKQIATRINLKLNGYDFLCMWRTYFRRTSNKLANSAQD